MKKVLAAVAMLALTAAAHAEDPEIINPRALFPEGP